MTTITREKYHDFWGVSNSSLNYALPECGGSYKKFTAFMAGEIGKEETAEMRLGTLIHKFMENPHTVFTTIEAMPSDALRRIVDDIKTDTRPELKDYAKDIITSARHFNYQKGWGDEAIAKKVITECSEYFKAKKSGAEIIDKDMAAVLEGITYSLRKDFNALIDDAEYKTLNGPDWKVEKEQPFTWEEDGITFKMLLDRFEINDKLKSIKFIDYKTTSTPLSFYTGYKGHKIEGTSLSTMKVEEEFHHGSMIRYHVHRQIQFYKRGLRILYPGYDVEGTVLAIEVNAPYEVRMVNISNVPVYVEYGDLLIERALTKVKEFFEKEISL